MDYAGYVLSGWAIAAAGLGGYVAWMLRRARQAAERVPPERRRWSDS